MNISKSEFGQLIDEATTKLRSTTPDYDLVSSTTGAYPYQDEVTDKVSAAIAKVFHMTEKSGKKVHNVVIGTYFPGAYFIHCGDNFIEGKNTKIPVQDRVRLSAETLDGYSLNSQAIIERMTELRDMAAPSNPCSFWTNFKKNGSLCKHCNQLLKSIPKPDRMLEDLDTQLKLLCESGDLPTSEEATSASEFAKLALKVPVLLEGEKGWGKTREARVFAETMGVRLLEIQGHESVEAADFTGYTVRYGHDMVWKDGKLSQAFRLAASGVKVCCLIDELLRIPQRQLSVLLSALSPYKGNYYLSTGRIVDVIEGIGSEETLVCPVENLYIIGTTNVGAQYAIDIMDPALQERFLLCRKALDTAILKIADDCVRFFEAMKALKPNGLVADLPNPRTMVRAVHLSDKESDMKQSVKQQILTWVTRDVEGNPVPEQLNAVTKAIDKVWK